ncbi:F-box/LRR-repeat protein 4-like [Crassostrea virginica]
MTFCWLCRRFLTCIGRSQVCQMLVVLAVYLTGSCPWLHSMINQHLQQAPQLDIGSCQFLDAQSISHLSKIRTLERLNLYRLLVEKGSLIKVLSVSPNLRHLNLGASRIPESGLDSVMEVIGSNCKRLISLDLWRCRLTEEGLNEIADNCPELQELDVGWW